MHVHELFQQDQLKPAGRRRPKMPVYDADRGASKFVLSEDAASVYKIVRDTRGRVIVPLVERDGHDLPDLAMAMIEAVLVERRLPVYDAATLHDAVLIGASVLEDLDLELRAVLVKRGTKLRSPVRGAAVVRHRDVEPGLVICLPDPQFLGMMPTVGDASFGMMVHNPDAVVPVRV
jgi:hypothetical protein